MRCPVPSHVFTVVTGAAWAISVGPSSNAEAEGGGEQRAAAGEVGQGSVLDSRE